MATSHHKLKRRQKRTLHKAEPINVERFEKLMRVRQLAPTDFEAVCELERQCFPGMSPWTHEQLRSHLAHFPEGQIVVEYEGRVVASSSSLVVDFSEYEEWHDWTLIAADGTISNHDPEGDTLYGIEMMVHPDYRGMRLSRRLYDARKELARRLNLSRIIIGGRIPGYAQFASEMTAREYVEYVTFSDLYDPVLTPQLANGFVIKGLISGYLESDSDSAGYATHLEWTNLDYVHDLKKRYKAVYAVRVAAVQWEMRPLKTFDDFAKQTEFYVDVAGDFKADFLVFPELFMLGLLSAVEGLGPGEQARHLAEYTPRYLELLTDLAVRYHVNIVGGSQFTLENDELHNVSYLFRRNGTIGRQYKLHITPNERRWWGISPGKTIETFDTDAGKIAINIDYDVQFPELARHAAYNDARLLFVPFSADEANGFQRIRYCAQARCIENHMYAVIAGGVGHLPTVENADIHYAESAILSPCDIAFSRDGVASRASANVVQVILHDLDLEVVRRHRFNGTTQNWRDRRRDLYACVFTSDKDKLEI